MSICDLPPVSCVQVVPRLLGGPRVEPGTACVTGRERRGGVADAEEVVGGLPVVVAVRAVAGVLAPAELRTRQDPHSVVHAEVVARGRVRRDVRRQVEGAGAVDRVIARGLGIGVTRRAEPGRARAGRGARRAARRAVVIGLPRQVGHGRVVVLLVEVRAAHRAELLRRRDREVVLVRVGVGPPVARGAEVAVVVAVREQRDVLLPRAVRVAAVVEVGHAGLLLVELVEAPEARRRLAVHRARAAREPRGVVPARAVVRVERELVVHRARVVDREDQVRVRPLLGGQRDVRVVLRRQVVVGDLRHHRRRRPEGHRVGEPADEGLPEEHSRGVHFAAPSCVLNLPPIAYLDGRGGRASLCLSCHLEITAWA